MVPPFRLGAMKTFVPKIEIRSFSSFLMSADLASFSFFFRLLTGTLPSLICATSSSTVRTDSCLSITRLQRDNIWEVFFSLNSARAEVYAPYYRPKDYHFSDVRETLRRAVAEGLFVSLNYLIFPGVTDREEEMEALEALIEGSGLHMVQTKNLCIDPALYLNTVPPARGGVIGIAGFLDRLRERFPSLDVGYFNRPKERFSFVRGGG